MSLLRTISSAKLEDGMKMKEYIGGVQQTADQLSEIDMKLDKVAVVGFILNGLSDYYRYLATTYTSSILMPGKKGSLQIL